MIHLAALPGLLVCVLSHPCPVRAWLLLAELAGRSTNRVGQVVASGCSGVSDAQVRLTLAAYAGTLSGGKQKRRKDRFGETCERFHVCPGLVSPASLGVSTHYPVVL
jgi:hypothetical protein